MRYILIVKYLEGLNEAQKRAVLPKRRIALDFKYKPKKKNRLLRGLKLKLLNSLFLTLR